MRPGCHRGLHSPHQLRCRHEIIRQGRRDLALARLAPDLVYEQLVAAGCARKLSSVGSEILVSAHSTLFAELSSTENWTSRNTATSAWRVDTLPAPHACFYPLRLIRGSDLPSVNPQIRTVSSPFDDEEEIPVRAASYTGCDDHPRTSRRWRRQRTGRGIVGVQREAALAARQVIAVVEQLVDSEVIRSDPNRTILPAMVVDAVCVEPMGAHPSYAQGIYDRDNGFYRAWARSLETPHASMPGSMSGSMVWTRAPNTWRASLPNASMHCA